MVVAALTGVVSGIWIFKPMLDGSLAEDSLPPVAQQEPLTEQKRDPSPSPGEAKGSPQAAA